MVFSRHKEKRKFVNKDLTAWLHKPEFEQFLFWYYSDKMWLEVANLLENRIKLIAFFFENKLEELTLNKVYELQKYEFKSENSSCGNYKAHLNC